MTTRTYLAWRALLAIALMIAFYGLALVMVALLIVFPVLLARVAAGLAVKVGLFCVVGVFVILKSILPRRDRFEPPGPRLEPLAQPRLFAEVRSVATAVGQELPAEVYLVPDVNAWVSYRGGLMGFGSRRVMSVGLPLLQTLTVAELRGVIAHEFGHFHGGDVAVGPWIYKTRDAIVRTVMELRDHSEALSKPFKLYGNLFFRITHAVSRHQEVLADRLAAGVAGPAALASGLRASQGAGLAFFPYWKGVVEPVLAAEFVPPLAAGFDSFLKLPSVAGKVAESLTEVSLLTSRDPYDTHPALPDRLKALGVDPASTERAPGPPAITLLEDVASLERQLAGMVKNGSPSEGGSSLNLEASSRELVPLDWADVGARVWLPSWERFARQPGVRRALAGLTPGALPELDWLALGRKLAPAAPEDEALSAADSVVGVAVGLALVRAGFAIESPPGAGHTLVGLGERVVVFETRELLANGPESADAWRSLCERAGISHRDLGTIAERKPSDADS